MAPPVWLFLPNLIGYLRVILAILAYYWIDDKWLFGACYMASFLADGLDGLAARMLGQTSQFGAVLDMVTDRAATTGLILVLSHKYQFHITLWIGLVFLDLSSHWFRMHNCLSQGSASHKSDSTAPYLLKLYYNSRWWLSGVCLGNELFYVVLYAHEDGPWQGVWLWALIGSGVCLCTLPLPPCS